MEFVALAVEERGGVEIAPVEGAGIVADTLQAIGGGGVAGLPARWVGKGRGGIVAQKVAMVGFTVGAGAAGPGAEVDVCLLYTSDAADE